MYKETSHAFFYTLKIWVTALLLSPVIIAFCESSLSNVLGDCLALMIIGSIFGAIFSFPSFCALWLGAYLIVRYADWNIIIQKIVLTFLGIGLSILPFFILSGSWTFRGERVPYSLIYAAVIVAGIWFYRLKPKGEESTEDGQLEPVVLKEVR